MKVWPGRLFVSGLVAAHLGLSGCQAAERPSLAGLTPDFSTLMSLPGCNAPGQARAQKPGPGPLDLGPEAAATVAQRGARIRAVVNGEAILEEEVYAAAFQGVATARSEQERATVISLKLTEIIERELLIQDATAKLAKRGGARFLAELEKVGDREFERQWLFRLMQANKVDDLEEFKKKLKEAGVPLDLFRRQWVRNFIAMEYLRTRIEPNLGRIGHPQIVEYYEKNPNQFQVEDRVVWQDIFIASARHPTPGAARQFAESLVNRLRRGEDFVKLAKEFDNGDSSLRPNAGGIGTKRGEIQPREAEAILFALKDGEIGPVVELDTGCHIIRMVKRTYAGKREFDSTTQRTILAKLKNQAFQQEMRKLIADLKSRAIIEIAQELK